MVAALFLHIQKTAGTSIIDSVRPVYGESITSHGDCWGHPPQYFADTKFVSGHIGYDYARHLMQSRYTFTFLRDPIERILSMYYFCRKQNPAQFDIYRAANELDLHDFLQAGFSSPLVKKNIWNSQVWQLAHGYGHLDDRTISDFRADDLLDLAVGHLDAFSYIGFTETFETDRDEIFRGLNLPVPTAKVIANRTGDRPRSEDLSGETKELLYGLTELDRRLYTAAFSRRNLKPRTGSTIESRR